MIMKEASLQKIGELATCAHADSRQQLGGILNNGKEYTAINGGAEDSQTEHRRVAGSHRLWRSPADAPKARPASAVATRPAVRIQNSVTSGYIADRPGGSSIGCCTN